MDFSSDNAWGVVPEIMAAIESANSGTAASYGNDAWTERLGKAFSDLFERDVAVFPVFTGTAANSIALACATAPWGAIYCHPESHIHIDECGAPEFYSGAKLLPIEGPAGKFSAASLEAAQINWGDRGVHSVRPMSVSITQATEAGTLYSLAEVEAISEVAKKYKLALHMDGARFANAVSALGCTPAELTWKRGVDLLSFGATKNGALAAEAIVVFTPRLVEGLEYRRKRAGHLSSKMRFVSAQLLAYLEDALWLRLAERANARAKRLAEGLQRLGVVPAYPVEANEIFVWLSMADMDALNAKGARLWPWTNVVQGGKVMTRMVTSFATPEKDIDAFLSELKKLAGK
jgi:threonine aldolase